MKIKLYNANLGLRNPSMLSSLPKTTVFLNLGLVEFYLDLHHFWKYRRDLDTRSRDNIGIAIAVMILSPLQEEERRSHITEAWPGIMTRKCWDSKEEEAEAEAEATVDCTDYIHDFILSLTVSWSQSTLSVVIVVVVFVVENEKFGILNTVNHDVGIDDMHNTVYMHSIIARVKPYLLIRLKSVAAMSA